MSQNDVFKTQLMAQQVFLGKMSLKNVFLEMRGGELGKAGPGPRAKADAAKHAKNSMFVEGFSPKHQTHRPSGSYGNGADSRAIWSSSGVNEPN